MSIFLTGGNGKVSRRVAQRLSDVNAPLLRSSRTPAAENTIKFDLSDRSTYTNVFQQKVKSAFIVLPGRSDCDEDVFAFVRVAIDNGVRCLVLLSAAVCEPGPDAPSPHGRIHHFLRSLEVDNLQVSILRPAFFMENFSEQQHLATIRDQNTIYSATGQGKEAFVSCEDIASIAAKCLLGHGNQQEYWIVGPKAISYDEIADVLSRTTVREVTHTKLSAGELKQKYEKLGMPEEYAQMMTSLDTRIANGLGEKPNSVIQVVLGREPVSFEEYVGKNVSAWL